MKKKAIVLLSGGVDSTTCLALAVAKYGAENVLAVTIFYGQKHHKELEAANKIVQHYGLTDSHLVINLEQAFKFSNCSLLQKSDLQIKHQSYAEQLAEHKGTVDTYVPFRNGLFLAYVTAIAVSVGAEVIYYGAHADDAAGRAYPDCTPEFEKAMAIAIYEGSGRTCKLEAPLLDMNKTQVVATGLKLKAPYALTWSCYEGKDKPCGECGTCIDRAKAFQNNGVSDPALEETEDV